MPLPTACEQYDLISLDFETDWDQDSTLRKLPTSDYVRDKRFKAHIVGVKINDGQTALVLHKDIAKRLKKINWKRSMLLAHNCVPADTEVLTRKGWRNIADVGCDQEILQWDPDTEVLSWVTPLAKVHHVADKLFVWDTNYHQGAYTAGHRMYIGTPDKRTWRAEPAERVATRSQNNTYIPTAGLLSGGVIDLLSAEARFMEAARADGSWQLAKGVVYGVRFKFSKRRKVTRLLALIDELNLPYTQSVTVDGHELIIVRQCALVQTVFALLGPAKQYGAWVLELQLHARRAILEEAEFWDGSTRSTARYRTYSWSTADAATADALQLMAHTSGWSFRATTRSNARGFNAHNADAVLHVGQPRERNYAKLVDKPAIVHGEFDVYCFTVPTGALLIRRNGVVNVTGN